jgi:DNA-binding NarL/FixJ family response regulator
MSITIFLADDHAVVRDGLRILLDSEPDIKFLGDAADGREAVKSVAELKPDVVVIDIAMPELNGIEATAQIIRNNPDTRVIVLSMHATSEHIFRALQAGASGYLVKESAGAEVVEAVRAVWSGQRYFSHKISDRVVDEFMRQYGSAENESPLARLSSREVEILQLVVEGKSSAQIAQLLSLSPKTVDTYRSRLMKKLDINDIPGLVKFAIQHGITPLD